MEMTHLSTAFILLSPAHAPIIPGRSDGGSDLEEGAGPEAVEVVAPPPTASVAIIGVDATAAPGVITETEGGLSHSHRPDRLVLLTRAWRRLRVRGLTSRNTIRSSHNSHNSKDERFDKS